MQREERIPRKEPIPMEQSKNEQLPVELSSQLVAMMTTEHYTLQTGRAMTIAELNGRSSLFVGAVSSGLIALAFVGQISHLGTAFFVFSLVVLPTLLFMGLITFERVLQADLTDSIYTRGINRIRHLYLEYAPQMQPYFILSAHDDPEGTYGSEGMLHPVWLQFFLSMPGMITVINSVLAGSFVGLLLAAFTLPLWVCTSAGVLTFLVSVGLHPLLLRRWMRVERNLPVLFPSQPG
jgi:hypothetical protein